MEIKEREEIWRRRRALAAHPPAGPHIDAKRASGRPLSSNRIHYAAVNTFLSNKSTELVDVLESLIQTSSPNLRSSSTERLSGPPWNQTLLPGFLFCFATVTAPLTKRKTLQEQRLVSLSISMQSHDSDGHIMYFISEQEKRSVLTVLQIKLKEKNSWWLPVFETLTMTFVDFRHQ